LSAPVARSRADAAVEVLLGAILFGVVLPFVVLSFFNHPQNDDYVFAAQTRSLGYGQTFLIWYKGWTPRYFALAGSVLSPVVFGSYRLYRLTAALTIGLLLFATYLFVREITRGALARRTALLATLAIAGVYLHQVPSPAQSLYWFNASLCYQYAGILLLSGLAFALRARRASGRRSIVLFSGFAGLLLFAAGGTNEMALLSEVGILGALAGAEWWRGRRAPKRILFLLGVSLAAAAVVFLSPGMWARHDTQGMRLSQALPAAWVSAWRHVGRWLFTTPMLPVLLLVFRSAASAPGRLLPFQVHPALALAASAAGLFLMFLLPILGANSSYERVFAFVDFAFVVLVFLNGCLLLDRWRERGSRRAARSAGLGLGPGAASAILAAAVLWTVLPASAMRTAWDDLLSGRAARFDREMEARYRSIRACAAVVCEVTPLENWPSTIKFFDDAYDPKKDDEFFSQYKRAFAACFGKHLVVSKGP